MNTKNMTRWLGRLAFCSLATLAMTLGACGDEEAAPACGDGEVNGDELCDGDDFDGNDCTAAGFEAGTVSCSDECELVTTECYVQDEDLDGLFYLDEIAAGTDPTNPDTDTDGVLDGTEFVNGTDPLSMNSYPNQIGEWPNRIPAAVADGLTPNGWTVGSTAYDWIWTDQFGKQVNLHQFYGYVTVLSLGSVWCPPCNEAASTSQALFEEHLDGHPIGVILVEQLTDGVSQGVPVTPTEVDNWVNKYQLQFPVVYAPETLFAPAIPTYYILDAKMRVHEFIEGYPGDAALRSAIASAREASME